MYRLSYNPPACRVEILDLQMVICQSGDSQNPNSIIQDMTIEDMLSFQ